MKKTDRTMYSFLSKRRIHHEEIRPDRHPPGCLLYHRRRQWQQWLFGEAGDGEYRIRNRFTGKVMDLAMSGVCNGTWVHQWTQTAGAGQRWQIVEAGGGKVKLRNVLADKVIDLVGMRVENGTQAQIWQDVFGENQLWKLDPVPERLLNKETPAPTPAAKQPANTPRPQPEKKNTGKAARRSSKNR